MEIMTRRLVFKAKDVEGFSLSGAEDAFVSRLLVDKEGVGANSFVINHFTLRPGKSTERGSHPSPFEEAYYVLSGTGRVRLGAPPETYEIGPGWIVFIPAGTQHCVENLGSSDMEILTVMTAPMKEGINAVYDGRIKEWGTSFKLKPGT